jgi:hypothetical protein
MERVDRRVVDDAVMGDRAVIIGGQGLEVVQGSPPCLGVIVFGEAIG